MIASPTRRRLLSLGALTVLGSLGTHMFVPALPSAAVGLRAAPAVIQQAISVYILGLAIGHFVWGPASDRFGRPRILKAAVAAFILGSLVCAVAPEIEILLVGRFVQALGGAGALITCRAMVADESLPGGVAGSLGILSAITLISPTLAPLLGGMITATFGWRSIFLLLAFSAAAGLVYLTGGSGPRPSRHALSPPAGMMRGYAKLLRNRRFLASVIANGLIVSSFYIFLTASPFLLAGEHGLSATQSGLCYFAIAGAMMIGTLLVGPLERSGRRRTLFLGLLGLLAGACSLVAGAEISPNNLAGLILPMMVLGFGSGLLGPLMLAGALLVEPRLTGSSSSLFGGLQMAMTAAISALVSLTTDDTTTLVLTISGVAVGASVIIVISEFLFRGSEGADHHQVP